MSSTALIVEDDRDHAELAAGLVRTAAYEAVVADSGAVGLDLARRLDPDVVLLDVMLPDRDGFEVCRLLRSDRATMATPIVMLTALGDDANRVRGFRVGANAYVTKPYGAAELLAAIARARAWKVDLQRGRVEGEIHVEIDSEIDFLQEVNDFLACLCGSTPLTPAQIGQLRQAVMEMGTNAIEWGNRRRVESPVGITYRVFADRVEVVIRDQGAGFDLGNLPHAANADDPVAHMDLREKLGIRPGGFGLMIARGMVDELRHNAVGNEVTLIKRFPDAAPIGTDGAAAGRAAP